MPKTNTNKQMEKIREREREREREGREPGSSGYARRLMS